MLTIVQSREISQLFKTLGDPFHVRLLFAVAEHEACVCHLERLLNKRQSYISQHLMSLRAVGLITARRDGKFIFYRLKDRKMLSLIKRAADFVGLHQGNGETKSTGINVANCACPQCAQ